MFPPNVKMLRTFISRKDRVSGEPFDSIKWVFEAHIKEPDTGEYSAGVMFGPTEDSPYRIFLWRSPSPRHNDSPDYAWKWKESED